MLTLPGEEGRTLPIYATFLSEIGHGREALEAADHAIAIDTTGVSIEEVIWRVLEIIGRRSA